MSKIYRISLLFLVIVTVGAIPPAGAEEANGRLTMQGALEVALRQHPALTESKEKMNAAQYQIGVSRAAYLPQVSYTSNLYYGNAFPASTGAGGASPTGVGGAGLKATDYYINRVSATQLIFDFGKTPGQIAQTRSTFQQTREDFTNTRQQVALDARTAYFGYLAAQRALKVEQDNVRQNQDLLKQAQGFYQVGLKAKIDVTKAEANLYDAEANLLRAKNALDLTRVTLMNALGLKTWPYKDLEDVLAVTHAVKPLADLKAEAVRQRPDLQRNRYQQDYNQAALRVARAGYFPTLSTLGSYGRIGPEDPAGISAWWVGVGLTMPLFDGLLTFHNVRVARANIQSTLAGAEVLNLNVSKEVEQAYLDMQTGRELIRATGKALEAAQENFRLAQGRYKAGVGTIIEVTDAQVQLSRAELKNVQALYDYQVYEAKLDKAVGRAF